MSKSNPNLKLQLLRAIKRDVLTLALRPGSDLDETKLSTQFGLSRTPLREVLRQLAGEGFLELRENKGARVSELSHTTLRDFFSAAPMIYGAVTQLAATHATDEQIDELKRAQERFDQALNHGGAGDRALANNRFHEITGEMADNIYLLPSFSRLLIDHARIGTTFYRSGTEQREKQQLASEQHRAIIDAIEARDAAAARELAIEHWALSRHNIESFVMPAGLDLPLGELSSGPLRNIL